MRENMSTLFLVNEPLAWFSRWNFSSFYLHTNNKVPYLFIIIISCKPPTFEKLELSVNQEELSPIGLSLQLLHYGIIKLHFACITSGLKDTPLNMQRVVEPW